MILKKNVSQILISILTLFSFMYVLIQFSDLYHEFYIDF